MKYRKTIKFTAVAILAIFIAGGGFVCWRINQIAAMENEMRCADLSRGKALVAVLDSIITSADKCPEYELKECIKSASEGQRAEWEFSIDRRDCSYALHTYSAPAWPIWIAVHLSYDSRSAKWKFICDGDLLRVKCP